MFQSDAPTDKAIYERGKTGSYATHLANIDRALESGSSAEYISLGRAIIDRIKNALEPLIKPAEEKLEGSTQNEMERRLTELAELHVPDIDKIGELIERMMVPIRDRKNKDYNIFHADDDTKITQMLPMIAEKDALQSKLLVVYREQLKTAGPDALRAMQNELTGDASLRESRNHGGHAEIKLLAIISRISALGPISQAEYDIMKIAKAKSDAIVQDAQERGMERSVIDKLQAALQTSLIPHGGNKLPAWVTIDILKQVGPKNAKLAADLFVEHEILSSKDREKFSEELFIVPPKREKPVPRNQGGFSGNLAERRTIGRSPHAGTDDDGEFPFSKDGRTSPHIDDDDQEGRAWGR